MADHYQARIQLPSAPLGVLRIYLDETGHTKDPNASVVGMAGCIASLTAWEQFEQEWATVLKEFGIRELHMKNFAHFKGEFSGWAEEKRRQLIDRLLMIIETRIDTWVGAVLPISQARPSPRPG